MKRKILKIEISRNKAGRISLAIILGGLSFFVMAGYFMAIDVFTSINSNWVTMKFGTAYMFFLCCISLVYKRSHEFLSGVMIITCLYYASSFFLGYHIGCFPVFDEKKAIQTIRAGLPCWFTLINFCFFGLYLLFRKAILMQLITIIASIAFLGYIFTIPAFYFNYTWSTSMALHTAIGFLLVSAYRIN